MMLKYIYLFQVKHPNRTIDKVGKVGNWLEAKVLTYSFKTSN